MVGALLPSTMYANFYACRYCDCCCCCIALTFRLELSAMVCVGWFACFYITKLFAVFPGDRVWVSFGAQARYVRRGGVAMVAVLACVYNDSVR